MMKRATGVLLTGLLLMIGLTATPAQAGTELDECLAVEGRVAYDQVTEGNDVVCVGSGGEIIPSGGDDLYLWLEEAQVVSSVGTDPGYDTLSLQEWDQPWVDEDRMFGVRVNMERPDRIKFTDYNDIFGDPNACDRLTEGSDIELTMGMGNDTVQCVTGNIFTNGGDDTIIGVTLGSTADAGTGVDFVAGDAGADLIVLGPGNDTSNVVEGGVDVVDGEGGTDTVRAGTRDQLSNVEVVRARRK